LDYRLIIDLEPNKEFDDFLCRMIREFNNDHSLPHQEARKKGAVQPINIIVSDNEKTWVGGINADVYWGWVEIHNLWFHNSCRKKGLGSNLLKQVETIAKEKGATKALLTTFEFQARSFYEKYGYQVVGEIKDYPPGSSYYTMVKHL
jgi:ribosomal protein S18 acetylase RimI-like enzyme